MRFIAAGETTSAKLRLYFQLVQIDGITPALAEAGGQPQISTNGAAWTNTGIGTLTAMGDGRYYADLTAAVVATAGDEVETRYKSASTAECPGDSVQVLAYAVGGAVRLVQASATAASLRRVYFQLVATDGITPAMSEAGGQPQISTNGAAWTNTGVGVLSAIGNGRYYADLTAAAVATVGDEIETRYASGATAECPGNSVLVVSFDPAGGASTGAVRTRLRASVVARLASLTMAGNPNALILDRIIENEQIASWPCMMLAYAGEPEVEESEMTQTDDVVYKFRLRITDRCHPDDNRNQDRYELWKQQVMRALRNQRASGVVESILTRVRPQAAQFLASPPAWELYTQDMMIECVCREPRGT